MDNAAPTSRKWTGGAVGVQRQWVAWVQAIRFNVRELPLLERCVVVRGVAPAVVHYSHAVALHRADHLATSLPIQVQIGSEAHFCNIKVRRESHALRVVQDLQCPCAIALPRFHDRDGVHRLVRPHPGKNIGVANEIRHRNKLEGLPSIDDLKVFEGCGSMRRHDLDQG
eukprot:1353111-Rhodomonas_salina.1